MDSSSEQPRQEFPILGRAQEAIQKTLNEIGLIEYLSGESKQITVAILGAGGSIEVVPLSNYLSTKGIGIEKVIAFDTSDEMRKLAEQLLSLRQDINFEYRSLDISDSRSFANEMYDMVIVRNPDVHRSSENWEKAFKNGFDHLKTGGIFLATTDIYADFVTSQLQRGGEVVKTYVIPSEDKVGAYFIESDLFIAKKSNL